MIRSNSCHSNRNSNNNNNNNTASTKLIINNNSNDISSNDLIINHTENTNNHTNQTNINKLRQRRQRNLTTSFRTNYTDFQHIFDSKQEEENINNNLDKFIDSLEDINNYLDKKLNENSNLNANINRKKTANKLTRHFTQPILFNSNNYENCKSSKSNDISENIKTHDTNNQVIMMIEEIGSNKNNQNTKSTTTSSTSIILNKYHQQINNNNNNINNNKSKDSTSSNKQLPRKFVSLSDILNNEKNFESSNSIINKNLTNTSNNTTTITTTTNNNNNKTIQQSINDLLTVQELFEELELDCDEQIKQLDEIERKRKENLIKKQKDIVNETKPTATIISSANNLSNDSNKLNLNNLSSYSLASFTSSSSSSLNTKQLYNNDNNGCYNSNLNINKRYEYLSNKFSSKLSNQSNRDKIEKVIYHDNKIKNKIQFDLINYKRKIYFKYKKKEARAIVLKKKHNIKTKKNNLIELIDLNNLIKNEINFKQIISIYFDNYLYLIDYLTNDCKCLHKLKKIPKRNRSSHKQQQSHQQQQQKLQNYQDIYLRNSFISPTIKLEAFLSSTKMNVNNNKIKIKPNTITATPSPPQTTTTTTTTSAPVQSLLDRRNAKLKSERRVMRVHLDNNDNEVLNDNAINTTMVCIIFIHTLFTFKLFHIL